MREYKSEQTLRKDYRSREAIVNIIRRSRKDFDGSRPAVRLELVDAWQKQRCSCRESPHSEHNRTFDKARAFIRGKWPLRLAFSKEKNYKICTGQKRQDCKTKTRILPAMLSGSTIRPRTGEHDETVPSDGGSLCLRYAEKSTMFP